MKTGKCKRCGETREVATAKLLGGATHGRPARPYPSNICRPCVDQLLDAAADGLRVVEGWETASIRRARLEFVRASRG